ncbi:Squalene epoxidase domain containing protein [Elaphomyces granulatus]|jgi:squalene monooxygenase
MSSASSIVASDRDAYFDDPKERRRRHHEADVLIVGAGIAGCALAVAFGKQGRSVLLLEKSLKEPDRIVGELLQPGGVQALEQLGLRDCLEGIDAIVVKGYDVIFHGKHVQIPYPTDGSSPAPEGRSFHHGRFIMKLREAAMANPNVSVVETTATSLITSSHTKEVLGVDCIAGGSRDCFFAHLTVIADGYASKFRRDHHPYTPRVKSKFWGLELIDAELPMPYHGHVVLSDSPPVLLYQIGKHETRALVDVPENLSAASVKVGGVKGYLRNTVLPSLPRSVQPSFHAAIERGALRSMPNSFLPPTTNKTLGLIILGDALNMRHPLTGGGMTVAFNDAVVLRDLLSPEKVPRFADTKLVMKQMSSFHWERKRFASVINILAQSLYSVFCADDPNLRVLQRGCFQYFQLGRIEGPIGLLAGLVKEPLVLFWHFCSVAFLSIWCLFTEAPFYQLPVVILRSISVFWTACIVIVPYMLSEMKR